MKFRPPEQGGVGICPFLGILKITFKYLLASFSPIGDAQLGHLPTNMEKMPRINTQTIF